MKKLTHFLSVVMLTFSLLTSKAQAFFWPDFTPLIPVAPQFCAMCTPASIQMALEYVDQVKQVKKDLEKYTDVTALKQLAKSYAMGFGSNMLNSFGSSIIKGKKKSSVYSMTIEECRKQNIDIDDERSIQKGFISLFLEYPSTESHIIAGYRKKGRQLKIDTALEAYITSVELAKRLYGQVENTPQTQKEEGKKAETGHDFSELGLLTQFNYVQQCLLEGNQTDESGASKISDACTKTGLQDCLGSGNGSGEEGENEDKMCLWRNAVLAMKLYEQFMIYNEYLISMISQYDAVSAIDGLAKIRNPKDGSYGVSDQHSSLLFDRIKSNVFHTNSITLTDYGVYADEEVKLSDSDKKIFKEYDKHLSSSEKIEVGDFSTINDAAGTPKPVPSEDFKYLETLSNAEGYINKAIDAHNMKQLLPSYRRIFQEYADMERYHNKVVEKLLASERCVLNYLTPYYKSPTVVWFGNKCYYYGDDRIYCHYSPERSLSGTSGDSVGLYDIKCPDDSNHKCYVQYLYDTKFNSGLKGYLTTLYQIIKDDQATADVEREVIADVKSDDKHYSPTVNIIVKDDTKYNVDDYKSSDNYSNQESYNSDEFARARQQEEADTSTSVISRSDDSSLSSLNSSHDASQNKSKSYGKSNSGDEHEHIKDHEQSEQEELENRKNSLFNWATGAEISKDIANDLNSSSPQFGSVHRVFPYWYDQKEFYDQYIDYKYANIKKYILTLPLQKVVGMATSAERLNDYYPYQDKWKGLTLVKSAAQQRLEAKNAISAFSKKVQGFTQPQQIKQRLATFDDLYENIINEKNIRIRDTKKLIKAKYKELDELNKQLSIINRVYNNQQGILDEAAELSDEAEKGLKAGDEMYKDRTVKFSDSKGLGTSMKEGREKQLQAKKNAEDLQNINAKALENSINKVKKEIKDLENNLEIIPMKYVEWMNKEYMTYKNDLDDLLEEYENGNPELLDLLKDFASDNKPFGLIYGAAQCLKNHVGQIVDNAYAQIKALRANQSIYYPQNHQKVMKIHNDMIQKIKSANLASIMSSCGSLGTIAGMASNVSITPGTQTPFDKVMGNVMNIYQDICDGVSCDKEDDRYFVSIDGRKDDMTAPKSLANFTSAPLREVFHFDEQDYGNVDKDEDGYITKESFLESGISIPEIWKFILSKHAYIEKDIDLVRLFGGSENKINKQQVARAGIFPCKTNRLFVDKGIKKNQLVIVDIDASFEYGVGTGAGYADLPFCQVLEYQGNKILDKESEYSFRGSQVQSLGSGNASELGQVLDIKSKNKPILTFNKTFIKAYENISDTEDLGSSPKEDYAYKSGNRTMFSHNQFGDYLDMIEFETKVANSMKELEGQIQEVKNSLASILEPAGYTITESFNLLNDSEYNEAAKALNRQKESVYIPKANAELQSIISENQTIAAKKQVLQHKVEVLNRDPEEIVNIYGDEDFEELKASIENKKADTDIERKIEEKKNEEFEKNLRTITNPYCPSYHTTIKYENKPGKTLYTAPNSLVKEKVQGIKDNMKKIK